MSLSHSLTSSVNKNRTFSLAVHGIPACDRNLALLTLISTKINGGCLMFKSIIQNKHRAKSAVYAQYNAMSKERCWCMLWLSSVYMNDSVSFSVSRASLQEIQTFEEDFMLNVKCLSLIDL